jgi:hypothetical protein
MQKPVKNRYFLLYEVTFLSLMSALVYVFKTYFKTPIGLAGHNGIFWVIPFVIGVGITRKFGSATYIGVLSGLLIGTIGMNDEGIFKFFEWAAQGVAIDVLALVFRGHLDNLAVGFVVGAFGNLVKGIVNFSLSIILTQGAHILLLGIGTVLLSHLIFGGLGGLISAIVLNRIRHMRFPKRGKEKQPNSNGKVPNGEKPQQPQIAAR